MPGSPQPSPPSRSAWAYRSSSGIPCRVPATRAAGSRRPRQPISMPFESAAVAADGLEPFPGSSPARDGTLLGRRPRPWLGVRPRPHAADGPVPPRGGGSTASPSTSGPRRQRRRVAADQRRRVRARRAAAFDVLLARPEVTAARSRGIRWERSGRSSRARRIRGLGPSGVTSAAGGPVPPDPPDVPSRQPADPRRDRLSLAWLTTRVYVRPRGHSVTSVSAISRDRPLPDRSFSSTGTMTGSSRRTTWAGWPLRARSTRQRGRRAGVDLPRPRRAALLAVRVPVGPGRDGPLPRRSPGRAARSSEAATRAEAAAAVRLPDLERATALGREPGGFRSLAGVVSDRFRLPTDADPAADAERSADGMPPLEAAAEPSVEPDAARVGVDRSWMSRKRSAKARHPEVRRSAAAPGRHPGDVDAGRRANSAKNAQRWDFVVVRERTRVGELRRSAGGPATVGAAAAIACHAGPGAAGRRSRSCGTSAERRRRMMLLAWALGIGSCPATVYDQDLARRSSAIPPTAGASTCSRSATRPTRGTHASRHAQAAAAPSTTSSRSAGSDGATASGTCARRSRSRPRASR